MAQSLPWDSILSCRVYKVRCRACYGSHSSQYSTPYEYYCYTPTTATSYFTVSYRPSSRYVETMGMLSSALLIQLIVDRGAAHAHIHAQTRVPRPQILRQMFRRSYKQPPPRFSQWATMFCNIVSSYEFTVPQVSTINVSDIVIVADTNDCSPRTGSAMVTRRWELMRDISLYRSDRLMQILVPQMHTQTCIKTTTHRDKDIFHIRIRRTPF